MLQHLCNQDLPAATHPVCDALPRAWPVGYAPHTLLLLLSTWCPQHQGRLAPTTQSVVTAQLILQASLLSEQGQVMELNASDGTNLELVSLGIIKHHRIAETSITHTHLSAGLVWAGCWTGLGASLPSPSCGNVLKSTCPGWSATSRPRPRA
jgi:hypothetical protein